MKAILEKNTILMGLIPAVAITVGALLAGGVYHGQYDIFVIATSFLCGFLFFFAIYSFGMYRKALAQKHTADLISDVLNGNEVNVPLIDRSLPTCWQERQCFFLQCPVYGREHIRCWLVDGTFCRGEIEGNFPDKLDYCYRCEVFRKAVAEDPSREMEERFYGLMYLLGDREKKVSEMYQGSELRGRMLEFLLNLSRNALSSLEVDALLDLVIREVIGQVADFAAIFVVDKDGELEISALEGFKKGIYPKLILDGGADFAGMVMDSEELMTTSRLAKEPWMAEQFLREEMPGAAIGTPLISRGRKHGLLLAGTFSERPYSEFDKQAVRVAADHIAMALSNANMYASARQMAATDGLTGLVNHRSLFEALEKELGRSRRYGHPLSLIMLDIDHFKRFNDSYGHPQGDKLLTEIAIVIKDSVRSVDTAARYGGEEFAILLPETPHGAHESIAGSAMQVAERIRTAVAQHSFEGRPGRRDVNMTVSLGVAEFPSHAQEHRDLVKVADTALYRAKALGRNRVELAAAEDGQGEFAAGGEHAEASGQ